MWLPTQTVHRAFRLLALLPVRYPPDALPFILLGAQFLVEFNARLMLDCMGDVPSGTLVVP
jgi:hypothetical protein